MRTVSVPPSFTCSPPILKLFFVSKFPFTVLLLSFWYVMEGKKQHSSSSSFTTELFGSNESPASASSSSSALFNSIFSPPSKAQGTLKNYDFAIKRDTVDKEDKSLNQKTDMSPFYEQQKSPPCHLSSSIYYGGQDIYTDPQITKNISVHSTQYSQEGEDDGRASRGNWWQGSLYY